MEKQDDVVGGDLGHVGIDCEANLFARYDPYIQWKK